MHTILITGAASGIGAGTASELAKAGNFVIVGDLNFDETEAVAKQIRNSGASAEAGRPDVTSDDSVVSSLSSGSGPIDVLVNNKSFVHDKFSRLARLEHCMR